MYICPTCNRSFKDEETITRHFLGCWKEHNPNHRSKSAPRSKDIINRTIDSDVLNFFTSLQQKE